MKTNHWFSIATVLSLVIRAGLASAQSVTVGEPADAPGAAGAIAAVPAGNASDSPAPANVGDVAPTIDVEGSASPPPVAATDVEVTVAPPAITPAHPTWRYEVDLAIGGRIEAYLPSPVGTIRFGPLVGGGGDLRGLYYLQPIINDDTPKSLQAYLQWGSVLSLTLGASGSETLVPPYLPPSSSYGLAATFAADGYVARFIALSASIGVNPSWYEVFAPTGAYGQSAVAVPIGASVGMRVQDTRLDAGYGITPNNGPSPAGVWTTGFQYGGFVRLQTVVRRFLWLSGTAGLIANGARIGASFAVYPSRALDIFGNLAYRRGTLYAADTTARDRLEGEFGLRRWVTEVIALGVSYAFTWYPDLAWNNVLTADIAFRL